MSSGDWAFGFYDEAKPTTYLCDYGKKESGAVLKWRSSEPEQELLQLKEAYKTAFGKTAKGPKANDIEWLKSKMEELSSSEDEKTKLELMKEEFKKVLGKSPKGPKANNLDWLKSKIEAESSDDEKSEKELLKEEFKKVLGKSPKGPKASDIEWLKIKIDEAKNPIPESSDDDSSDDESSDDDSDGEETEDLSDDENAKGTGMDKVGSFKFEFEGVSYTRTFANMERGWKLKHGSDIVWNVEDEFGNVVGEWVGDTDSNSGWINWEEKCWEDIHKDHDDYDEDA